MAGGEACRTDDCRRVTPVTPGYSRTPTTRHPETLSRLPPTTHHTLHTRILPHRLGIIHYAPHHALNDGAVPRTQQYPTWKRCGTVWVAGEDE